MKGGMGVRWRIYKEKSACAAGNTRNNACRVQDRENHACTIPSSCGGQVAPYSIFKDVRRAG